MLEFYAWPSNARLLITFFFAVCVLTQSASLVLSRSRHPKTRLHSCESLLELAVLLQIFCLSLMHGQVNICFEQAGYVPSGYAALRIFAFFFVTALAVPASAIGRRAWPLLTILSALSLLPWLENASGGAYPFIYLLSLAFLLVRALHLSLLRYQELKTGLSALSVKEAIDNLGAGILFCREDGRILLESRRMQELMTAITGTAQRNGALFYEGLMSGACDSYCERATLDEQVVCLLADGSAWMFTKTEIGVRGRKYIQLTASDVSERYRLTAELNRQDAALKRRSEELRLTIESLHELSRERETQRAKMRAHDVLGQRLTVLLRMVRGDRAPDVELLKSLSEGLLRELSERPGTPAPAEELEWLRQIFGSIGVELRFEGELPEDGGRAQLLVDAVREAVVNAVRHGFATEVRVLSRFTDGGWQLRVENNGHPPTGPIVEGGGIGAMRERLSAAGGALSLSLAPEFALSITLPGG